MRILLAADGTAQSDAATEIIDGFKFSDGDEVKIISVIDMAIPTVINVHAPAAPLTTAEMEQTARNTAAKILETTRRKIRAMVDNENVFISTEILFGSPDSRIVETAEKMAANLIIVGSHGDHRWAKLLRGSISDSVVHHAPCSVLIVKIPKDS